LLLNACVLTKPVDGDPPRVFEDVAPEVDSWGASVDMYGSEDTYFHSPEPLTEGCEGKTYEGTFGSSTLAKSSDGLRIYAVNRDAGTVTITTAETGATEEIDVGVEPTRLVRVGSHVYVSLRAVRTIVVLEEQGASLTLIDSIPTGAEPFGLVAHPDGLRFYAAISMEDRVLEISAETHKVLRSWVIPSEPRWLAIHPNGNALFVASAMQARLWSVSLKPSTTGSHKNMVGAMPVELPTFSLAEELLGEMLSDESMPPDELDQLLNDLGIPLEHTKRITGDPTVSPDGSALFVPMLYVDNLSLLPPGADVGGVLEDEEEHGDVVIPGSGSGDGYSSPTRLIPAIDEIPLEETVTGDVLVSDGPGRLYRQDGVMVSGENVVTEDLFGDEDMMGFSQMVTSYPTSVTISPDCRFMISTMEGMDAIAISSRADICGAQFATDMGCTSTIEGRSTHVPPTAIAETGAGPGGLTWIDDRIFVHALLDRDLSSLPIDIVRENLDRENQCPTIFGYFDGYQEVAVDPIFLDANYPLCSYKLFETQDRIKLTDFELPRAIEEGRRLFFSARNPRMSDMFSSISCATCHPGGRNDGLTWHFEDFPRQTPSLAGEVSATQPVSWFNDVPTVSDEVMLTSQGRMGGIGLTEDEANDVTAFIDWSRPIDNSAGEDLPDWTAYGRQIFQDPLIGCGTCHSGPALTDNELHLINGIWVRTPTLVGIRATGPYFHDGSMANLREVTESAGLYGMGTTALLTDAELDALIIYLESL